MAKRTLTLDIRENGIDWVLLRSGLRNVTVEKSGQLVCRFDNAPPDTVAALKNLRDSLDAPGLTCIAAIEGRGLFARSINVPFRDRRKVRQILPLELEATLPVGVDDLAIDFKLTGNNGTRTALAAAMPKAQIDLHLSLLRQAGLDPALITFSGLPAATLLAAGPDGEQASLLIDGDEDHSMLFLIANHQLRYLRSWIPPAGEEDPAGRLKRAVGQTLEAICHVLPAAADVRTVYLTPRGARHYSPERTAAMLERAVKVFDPTQSVTINLTGNLSGGHGQGALALGLYEPMADKGLNFFRTTFPLKRFLQQHRKDFVRTGVLATVLAAVFMADVYSDIRRNRERAAKLSAEAETILKQTFPQTRNIEAPLQQMIVKLREARADEMASPRGDQPAKIDVLRAISQSLPPSLDIHVSQLVVGTEDVQISGTTGTFEAVNEAQGHLKKTGVLYKINIISANMDQKTGRVRFKLTADLQEDS
jgi:hypothetical protein